MQGSQEGLTDFDYRTEHGISYPSRIRKNVMMVRVFNGYLSETQDEALDLYKKKEIKAKAIGTVKMLFSNVGRKSSLHTKMETSMSNNTKKTSQELQ